MRRKNRPQRGGDAPVTTRGTGFRRDESPAGAGDQRAQAPQIYREKRFFLKKKCAGECTVLKFICMFAVLSFIEPRGQ